MVVSTVKNNRSATSSIPKPRLAPNSSAHRVAATAIARQLAIRENSVYSWLENHHGFEFPSIFEWRGFPVSKRSSSFHAMQTRLGIGQDGCSLI